MRSTLLILLLLPQLAFSQLKHRTEIILLMGSRFEITPFATTDILVEASIDSAVAEIRRIESVISEWQPNSEISLVNKNAGIKPINVSSELYGLVKRSKKVSDLTNGAFDISWAAARNLWKFDGSMKSLPDKATLDSLSKLINYNNIILNDSTQTIFLKNKGMAIGLGAIGKGYAANRAKIIMQQMGVANGIVIAGGDLITWGNPSEGKSWPIGIADPKDSGKSVAWFEIGEAAVVTSGDYEHYAVIDGKRYGHILDPRTCFPVEGLHSVTIICPDAEIADALSTSVFVLGKDKGLSLVNQLKGVECVIIDINGNFYSSSGINLNKYQIGEPQNKNAFTIGNNRQKK